MITKKHIFRKFLLDHEDFFSGMPFMSFYNDFGQSLQNIKNYFFAGKYLPPRLPRNLCT